MWVKQYKTLLIVLVILCEGNINLFSQDVDSQVTVFYRCYSHLTRTRPVKTNPLLIAVRTGQMKAVDACMELIKKTEFNGNGSVRNASDPEIMATLKTFYNFHRLWFGVDNLDTRPSGPVIGGEFRHMDETEPALFITRALFQPNTRYNSIVTARQSMRAIRQEGPYGNLFNENGNASGSPLVKLTAPLAGIHRGELLGIQALSGASTKWIDDTGGEVEDLPLSYFMAGVMGYGVIPLAPQANPPRFITDLGGQLRYLRLSYFQTGVGANGTIPIPVPVPEAYKPFRTPRSFGAGILGTQSYVMMNSGFPEVAIHAHGGIDNINAEETKASIANGGNRMHRRWAKNIMEDLLCRELPALRTSDVGDVVLAYNRAVPDVTKRIPFRESTTCMSCHGTMDPMAATIRGVYFQITYQNDWNRNGRMDNLNPDRGDPAVHSRSDVTMFARLAPVTQPREKIAGVDIDTTMVQRDPLFANRPANGALRYRSFDGTRVDLPLPSTNEYEGLQNLGNALANSKDLYVCAAKRYFEYFTGISVSLRDPDDTRNPKLTESEQRLRSVVTTLGASLAQHQNLKTLIHDILETEIYQNLGVTQ